MQQNTVGAARERERCFSQPCTGSPVTVLVPGHRTEGRFALVEMVERAGAAHPLHVHSREDEIIHVLEGRVRFHLDGAWIERGAGESLHQGT